MTNIHIIIEISMNKMKTNWNLNLIISEKELNEIEIYRKNVENQVYEFINKWEKRNEYLEDPKVLFEALKELEKLNSTEGVFDREFYYYSLQSSLDQSNTEIRAKINQLTDIATKLENELEFFTNRISKIPESKQKEMLSAKELSEYKNLLRQLFISGKHTLTESEEKIMNLKGKVSHYNWTKMLSGLLSKEEAEILGEDEKLDNKNFSEIVGLINSKNKKVRDSAAKVLNQIFVKHLDVAENEFNSVLENKKVNDEIRKYNSPQEASLIRDDIDEETVKTLVKVVNENLDIAKKYYELKAKLFGLEKLEYHERNLEYGNVEKKYEFDESHELVRSVFSNLDKDFVQIFDKFFENGQVDVFPKKGKASGAFCTGVNSISPHFVLLNYTDQLNDVRTFAHEFGHAINHDLIVVNQNALNASNSLATAETASTFFEDFVFQELLKDADDELKLSLQMSKLNDDISTIIRQITFFNFEEEIHSEFRNIGYLSSQKIGEIFQKHMKSYMGDFVEQSEGSENWWIYVNHFRYFFYVYSYSMGALISKGLQSMVKSDKAAIDKVKFFLKQGENMRPVEVFNEIGININDEMFWRKGMEQIKTMLDETETLAMKLGKIG
jgi:oligoendopeptidase F